MEDSNGDVAMGDIELDDGAMGASGATSACASASQQHPHPSSEQVMQCQCPVVVDGANVALSGTGAHESGSWEHCDINRIPTTIQYFRSKGVRCFAFLPQFWAKSSPRGNKPWNPEDIKTMVDQKLIVLTPAQAHDDHFIIGYAKERDGFVVTNDMFRDHIAKANDSTEQEAIRTWCAERIIPYTFVGQEFVPEPSKMTNLNRHVNLHYVAGCPNVTHQLGSDQSFPSERNPPLSVTEHSTREASYFQSTCSMDLDTDVTDFAFSHAGTRPETNAARALRERPVQREDVSQVRVSSERRVKVDKHLESLEKESKESFLRQLEQTDLPHFFYKHFANIYSHVFQNAQMRVMAKIRKAWREYFNVEKVEYTDLPETIDSALPTLTIQVTTRFLQRYTSILKEEYDDGEVTTEEKANEILWGSDVQKLLGEEATTAVANAMQQT